LPVLLLAGEYLILSFVVDLTDRVDLRPWIRFYRVAAPVTIGAIAAGLLVARSGGRREARAPSPPWRPWKAVALNLAAFGAAMGVAWTSFAAPGPAPVPPWALPALLALGVVGGVAAIATAGPLRWLLERARAVLAMLPLALGVGFVAFWITTRVEAAWGLLSAATLRTVGALLRLTGGAVVVIPEELAVGLGHFEVEIAPACSGVEGIGLYLLFGATWIALAWSRIRLRRVVLLLPLGALAAFLLNALRIAVLVWVGAAGHEGIALGGLHSKLGWLLSVGLALGSVALVERARWFRRLDARPGHAGGDAPGEAAFGVPHEATAYLGPLLAALATALFTGVLADGPVDRWYGARIVAALAVLLAVRGDLPSLVPSRAWWPAALGVAVAAAWVAFAGEGRGAGVREAVAGMDAPGRWAWIAVRVLGSVLVIPVVEELAFRGFLLSWIVSPDPESVPPRAWTWPAVLLSSLAFGALHSELILGTLAGLAFAAARLWRGRLGDAVLAHAVANAGVAVAVLLGGRWGMWG
jgi:exosortase E/protease (VPEID-CTERM system)